MYLAWYLVPLSFRLICINILGKSQEWIESYPYTVHICLSIEAVLAILLFKLWREISWLIPVIISSIIIYLACTYTA